MLIVTLFQEMEELFLTASHSSVNDKFLSQDLLSENEKEMVMPVVKEESISAVDIKSSSSYPVGKAATL